MSSRWIGSSWRLTKAVQAQPVPIVEAPAGTRPHRDQRPEAGTGGDDEQECKGCPPEVGESAVLPYAQVHHED